MNKVAEVMESDLFDEANGRSVIMIMMITMMVWKSVFLFSMLLQ